MQYITGASGFLGSHLTSRLEGVTCSIPHDLIYTTKLEPFENFFFLSTYGNMSYHDDEQEIIKANILDLVHVLKQTDFSTIHSFVYVSSSSVKRKVQTMYSRTKKAAEEILLAFAEKYNAPICIIRPLSITGVGDQEEHLIPTLIKTAMTNSEMPFVPDAYHDYIDVDDVVDGIIALSKRRARGVFELGTGKSRSNQEVREMVEFITGKPVNVNIVKNMRSYDSSEWVCDNFKARTFGWEPKKSLKQTITEMVGAYGN